MSAMLAGEFAAVAIALYAGHHVGDYWVQTDDQAKHKGDAGADGVLVCSLHVLSYLMTQFICWAVLVIVLDLTPSWAGVAAGFTVSGVTHYMADRREHGLMFWLARRIPGKAAFLELGRPREPQVIEVWGPCHTVVTDNPQLATGAWALDQSWHIFWGVFVTALLMVTL